MGWIDGKAERNQKGEEATSSRSTQREAGGRNDGEIREDGRRRRNLIITASLPSRLPFINVFAPHVSPDKTEK